MLTNKAQLLVFSFNVAYCFEMQLRIRVLITIAIKIVNNKKNEF